MLPTIGERSAPALAEEHLLLKAIIYFLVSNLKKMIYVSMKNEI